MHVEVIEAKRVRETARRAAQKRSAKTGQRAQIRKTLIREILEAREFAAVIAIYGELRALDAFMESGV